MTEDKTYTKRILRQRKKRESEMVQSPRNWFSLVGLYPLYTGDNTLGKGAQYTIDIPELPVDAEAVLAIADNSVSLRQVSGGFSINGSPASPRQLRTDMNGQPDLLESGSIAMLVIQRGKRLFLRVWDREAPALKDFHGLNYFPVDPAWRIIAEFFPSDPPREVTIHDAIGGATKVHIPGYARFEIKGVTFTLMGEENDDGLLFSFSDLTRQDATYPGGRYLLTDKPIEGQIVLDFNQARNWPCAYTSFATCPLPPAENHLGVRVEAGEKRYHD